MAWNDKYWDIISNLYWTPRYLGLKSIGRDKWRIDGDQISIPKALIANTSGPLYSRARTFGETRAYLNGQEEILNQVFNLVFSIAGDEVVSRLLCRPLEIADPGPFESIGREIGARYGWRKSENVTQQDGFFVTSSSIVAVELKLGSTSWPEQIAKYVALMIWEEEASGTRENLGLLFIVPETALLDHWTCVGLGGPNIDAEFIKRLDQSKLPKKIQSLFEQEADKVAVVLDRLRLAVVSWTSFRDQIVDIEKQLDCSKVGDQTLQRLLGGLLAQINDHDNTGLARSNTPAPGQKGSDTYPSPTGSMQKGGQIMPGGKEFFSVVDGKITDVALHEEILAGGDHAAVTAIGRAQAKKIGLNEQELDLLYGPNTSGDAASKN